MDNKTKELLALSRIIEHMKYHYADLGIQDTRINSYLSSLQSLNLSYMMGARLAEPKDEAEIKQKEAS